MIEEKVEVVPNGNGALCVSAVTPVPRKTGTNGYPCGLQEGVVSPRW